MDGAFLENNNDNDWREGSVDFAGVRMYVISFLKKELNPKLVYHSLEHTLKVEEAVILYAKAEGISKKNTVLLKTAALFHDLGYVYQYKKNEPIAVKKMAETAPKFGYNENDIKFMSQLILATTRGCQPTNIFEEILCDADHDYLGRDDYHELAHLLYQEFNDFGQKTTNGQWLKQQIDYLETEHQYYTEVAINYRQNTKETRIMELKEALRLFNLKK